MRRTTTTIGWILVWGTFLLAVSYHWSSAFIINPNRTPHNLKTRLRESSLEQNVKVLEHQKNVSNSNSNTNIHTRDEKASIADEARRSIDVQTPELSRRKWLFTGASLATVALIGGGSAWNQYQQQQFQMKPKTKIAPVNLTQVAKETRINITMECTSTCITIDTNTFQKKQSVKLPSWFPSSMVPSPQVVKDIPNSEILIAAITAGSVVEMARTSLLYPLLTLKTRIQADVNHRYRSRRRQFHWKRRLQLIGLNMKRHWREGQLYAGIYPSLLASVPATGVYFGVRDVVRRGLLMTPLANNDLALSITAAFFADVASLMIRTPADTLALRLQIATGKESSVNGTEAEEEVNVQVGSWFIESIERLPAVVLTDLPYVLSRIALSQIFLHGDVGIGYYEAFAITIGILTAFLTTPFDVARTRILVDSDNDPTNGIDGGSGEGLMKTFQTIYREGDGRMRNLFAGWLERTVYLGIGRAWIEPFMIVGYIAIRDAILLEWFD